VIGGNLGGGRKKEDITGKFRVEEGRVSFLFRDGK